MTYTLGNSSLAERRNGARHAPKTVMIVEDNELNMKLFHDLLDAHGYRTLQTRTGMEALKLARQQRPDLILMDIQLPEVSGLEVTKWLKDDETLCDIPVIAVTAFAMKGDEERIRRGGCEAYISKPISIATFLDEVRRLYYETSAQRFADPASKARALDGIVASYAAGNKRSGPGLAAAAGGGALAIEHGLYILRWTIPLLLLTAGGWLAHRVVTPQPRDLGLSVGRAAR